MSMSKKNKQNQPRCCETCSNLIPIGEGDYICCECGKEPIMPISEYDWTDDYYKCCGKKWSE